MKGAATSSHPALRVLASAGYRRLVAGGMCYSLAQMIEQLTVGWFVLQTTGSVFLTALTWAVRSLPNLLFGSIGGAISDRYPRNRVLAVTAGLRALNVAAMAWVALSFETPTLFIMGLVAFSGLANTTQLATTQALAADNAASGDLAHAVSTLAFAARAIGAIGVLGGGFVLARLGPAWTFLAAALPLVAAAGLFATVPVSARQFARQRGLFGEVLDGVRVLSGIPTVTRLLALMAAAEILGFSYNAFMPVVADRILGLGPEGLGALLSAASLGAVVGTGLLAALPFSARQGRLLLQVIVVFGLLVLALPLSKSFLLSLGIVAFVGACASLIDTLQHSLLQRSVDESLRGRVLGAWNVAIGMGWLGPVLVGALAEAFGVGLALGLAGGLLSVIGLSCFGSKLLRNAG